LNYYILIGNQYDPGKAATNTWRHSGYKKRRLHGRNCGKNEILHFS